MYSFAPSGHTIRDMSPSRRLLQIVFRYVLPLAVVVGVGTHFSRLLGNADFAAVALHFRWEYLLASAVTYALCHALWGTYWTLLLRSQGVPASLPVGLRAYFISQGGKYVPGKIWVILLRIRMLGGDKQSRIAIGVTAFAEAVTSMATGAMIGAFLLPLIVEDVDIPGLPLALGALACVPVLVVVLNRMVVRFLKKRRAPGTPTLPGIPPAYLAVGLAIDTLGWALMALSFWLAIQGLTAEPIPLTLDSFGRLAAINCLSYVAGFIALFAPAGAGIREGLMQKLLAVQLAFLMGEGAVGFAVVVALVVRVLWTAAEVAAAAALWKLVRVPAGGLSISYPSSDVHAD